MFDSEIIYHTFVAVSNSRAAEVYADLGYYEHRPEIDDEIAVQNAKHEGLQSAAA